MSPVVLALALLLVCVIGFWLLELLIKRPKYGAAFVLVASVFDIAFAQNKPAVAIGGAKINIADFVFVLVVGAAVARLVRARSLTGVQRLLIGLALLAVFSLLRGIGEFGLQTAVNDFRGYMRFLGGALYMSSYPVTRPLRNSVGKSWIIACVAVCVIAMLRWVESFTGVGLGPISADYGTVIRSISGGDTFFVAAGFLVSMVVWRGLPHDTRSRWISAYLAVMVVLLNRRTVWVAVMAGVVVMLFRDRTLGRKMVTLGAAAIAITAAALVVLPGLASEDEELVKGATDTSNLAWRIEGWTGLLESWPDTLVERAAGAPFGSGFEREVSDRTLESNPHSFYLETMLRLGIVGLVMLGVIYAITGRQLLRMRGSSDGGYLGIDTLLVVLASQLVWYITWAPGYEQGLLLGMAMSAAAQREAKTPVSQAGVALRPAHNSPQLPEHARSRS